MTPQPLVQPADNISNSSRRDQNGMRHFAMARIVGTMQRKPIHPLSVWIPVIIIVLGLVVGWNYMIHLRGHQEDGPSRPPFLNRLEQDITLIERSGREVNLSELLGTVYLVGYVFTECPRDCIGVLTQMSDIEQEFRGEEGLKFLAVSLDPERDTPERLSEWASIHGVDRRNWWFLTTDDPPKLANYMHRQMMFMTPIKHTDPEMIAREGRFAHDSRIALIDHGGHLRGFYPLIDPNLGGQAYRKLLNDLRIVLEERRRAQRRG